MLPKKQKKKKKKNQKHPNVSKWNHGWKTGAAKVHALTFLHHTIDYTWTFIHWLLTHLILIKFTTMKHEFRSSRRIILKNFAISFYKVAGLQVCNIVASNFVKKTLLHRCFPVKFDKFLKTTYFEEHLWMTASVYWLLHHILSFTIHYSIRFSFLQIDSLLSS